VDVGALCLSSWQLVSLGFREANGSHSDEDKHKAPTQPHIHPLSLQDGGGRFLSFPDSVVNSHQALSRAAGKWRTGKIAPGCQVSLRQDLR